jgi:hypothetical protein
MAQKTSIQTNSQLKHRRRERTHKIASHSFLALALHFISVSDKSGTIHANHLAFTISIQMGSELKLSVVLWGVHRTKKLSR